MNHIVRDRESIFDIALITSGTAEDAYAISLLNNKCLSTRLSERSEIQVNNVSNQQVVNFFKSRIHKPATITKGKVASFDLTFDTTFRLV